MVPGRWGAYDLGGTMLRRLRIENLVLIQEAELTLAPGLNAITGETGAGKTVLAHALDLLLGGRARQGIVRPGAEEAYVEGCFERPPAPTPAGRDLRPAAPLLGASRHRNWRMGAAGFEPATSRV